MFPTLLEKKPYGDDVILEKRECVNHLRRNLRKKLIAVRKNRGYPIEVRRRICDEDGKSDIIAHINKAVDYWKLQDIEWTQKVKKLEADIKNTPNHVLGNHKSCG